MSAWTMIKTALASVYAARLSAKGDRLCDSEPARALGFYERALKSDPRRSTVHYKRGNALMALGRPADAAASYATALALKHDYADALYNRGLAFQRLKKLPKALADFDAALNLKPDDAEALNNRGNVLLEMKRPADAIASYDKALALRPDYIEALHNRSLASLDLKQPADAVVSLTRLSELAPDYPFVHGKLLHAKMLACDWDGYAGLTRKVADELRAGKRAAEPFGYQAVSDSPQDLRICAANYAGEFYPRAQKTLCNGEIYSHDRIRIGYVAGEFREQATAYLIAELFERHDRSRFELYAYDNGWDDGSALRKRIERAFDRMTSISGVPDDDAAGLIRADEIDILVNLNGYFGGARQGIFALRPAPVQVNYLGFPGTLGTDYMDYIVADRTVIPENEQRFYDEKVVYLPDSYQVNDGQRSIGSATPPRAELGLPDQAFVFCCFNNSYKITPAVFEVWMRILGAVPGSVLWLYEDNAAATLNLRRAASARGVAADRLIFARNMKLEDHLARHRCADLFLDTLPYNAHTTASDALWAGLPLLTCLGTTFPGRVAASLLQAIGLPELIATDLAQYEALAIRLATTPAMLADVRARLARNRSTFPLFNCARFARHLESAYTSMWERAQRGEAPAGFSVMPIQTGVSSR